MITAIAIDDPQIGATAVLHDIHRFAHVDNTFSIRRNLWVTCMFKAENVVCDKDISVDVSKCASES